MARKLDARQTISRDLLDQLTLSSSHSAAIANEKPVDSTELDNLLRSLNSETTDPVRLRANDPADLIVNLDASQIVNPEKSKNRLMSPVDSTIGQDMGDVFTGGTITFGATLAAAVTVSAGTGLANLATLSVAAAGHGSVGVFIDGAGTIVLSASQAGALLANDLPFPVVKPGLAFVGMIEVEFDAADNIVAFDDSKLFQFTNPDSNTLRDVVAQDRNTMLVGGGTWSWDHSGRNEIQRFAFDAIPDAGTFTIDLAGDATAAIAFNATAADIETAIETGIAAITDVKVDGSFAGDFTVEFVGVDANTPIAQMTTPAHTLTNSAVAVVTTDSTDQEGVAVGASGNLSFTEDAVIHVPGVANSENTIPTTESPIALQDDEVAYVSLVRDIESTAAVSLTVNIASIDSDSLLGNDTFVIARRYNGEVLVADTFKLENQESQSLEASASDQTLQYIGAFNEADANPDYESTTVIAQNDDLTTAISKLDAEIGSTAVATNQDRNIKMIGGGTWLWDLATTTLSWSADAYVQVPDFDDDRNTLTTGTVVLAANEVAYIELNRASNILTTPAILTANINALVPTDDTVIIARRDGADVIVGTHSFRLRDEQPLELDGALQEIRRLNDQLKIIPSATAVIDEVDILGADITQLDLVNGTQSTLVQELDETVLNFDGATINFTTGVISGGPVGTNFVPAVIPVGEYHWYSVSLEGAALDATNRTTATVEVGVALTSNAVQATAPYADFEGAKKLGQVQVQNIAGTITVVDIRRLGAGSGSGGGGMCIEDLVDKDHDIENGETCFNPYMDVALGTTVTLESSSHFVSIDPVINGTLIVEPGSEFQLIDVSQDEYETKVVSAAVTAVAWDELLVDTSGAGFTVSLPFSPVHGTRVKVKDRGQSFDSNNMLLATTDGSSIDGSATPYTFDKVGAWAECVFDAADNDWKLFQSLPGSFSVVEASANYTAKDLEDVICDTSGGSFTVSLPNSPSEGTRVRIKDSVANFDVDSLFVATTDGSTIENFATPFEFDVERTWAEFVYVSATNDWEMFSPLVGDIDWRTAVLTANYTASNDDELMCDTTLGSFTVTLPDGATIGDGVRVRVKDYGDSFNANNLSIATIDGSTIESTVQPLIIDEDGAWAEFVWMSTLNDWRVFTPIVGGGWQTAIIDVADSPYASLDEQELFVDTSGGAVTVDLDAAPLLGDRIRLIDYDGSWGLTNVTVNGNGNNIMGAATLTLNVANAWSEVVYNGTEWRIIG